jgi:hypothetical protein
MLDKNNIDKKDKIDEVNRWIDRSIMYSLWMLCWFAQLCFGQETIDATLNRVSASGVSGGSYFTGSAGTSMIRIHLLSSLAHVPREVKSIKRDASGRYLAVAQSRGCTWMIYEWYCCRYIVQRFKGVGHVSKVQTLNIPGWLQWKQILRCKHMQSC